MNKIHTNKSMKKKKTPIIILVIILILAILGASVFLIIKDKTNKQKKGKVKKPDLVIQGTEKNPIKLEGFEVKKIDIYNKSDTSIDVQATIINNTEKTVSGFFIEIGLFDKKGKQITVVAENHEEEIAAGEEYVLTSHVVGQENISKIKSARLLNLEKNTKAIVEDSLKAMSSNKNP